MKKVLLPLLMLILAGSFLLAVESSPSAIVGYVKYPCVTGLNLIAFPMAPGFASADEFSTAMGGNVTTVNFWLPDVQDWYAIDYNEMFGWSDEFVTTPGTVMYVNAQADFSCYSMGTLPGAYSVDLVEGLNVVMVPLDRSDLSTIATFGDAFGGNVTTVNKWLNDIQDWYAVDYNEMFGWSDTDYPAAIGDPFYVNSSVAMTWPGGAKHVKTLQAPARRTSK